MKGLGMLFGGGSSTLLAGLLFGGGSSTGAAMVEFSLWNVFRNTIGSNHMKVIVVEVMV